MDNFFFVVLRPGAAVAFTNKKSYEVDYDV